jgi:hypothetical protein
MTGLNTVPLKVTATTFIIIIIIIIIFTIITTTIIIIVIIIITSYYFAGFVADFKMLLSKLFLNESQHYAVLVASIHITRFVRI